MAKEKKDIVVKVSPIKKVIVPPKPKKAGGSMYTLVSLDLSGEEKPNTEFNISERQFLKTYHHLTKEGGNQQPKFAIKKKN